MLGWFIMLPQEGKMGWVGPLLLDNTPLSLTREKKGGWVQTGAGARNKWGWS